MAYFKDKKIFQDKTNLTDCFEIPASQKVGVSNLDFGETKVAYDIAVKTGNVISDVTGKKSSLNDFKNGFFMSKINLVILGAILIIEIDFSSFNILSEIFANFLSTQIVDPDLQAIPGLIKRYFDNPKNAYAHEFSYAIKQMSMMVSINIGLIGVFLSILSDKLKSVYQVLWASFVFLVGGQYVGDFRNPYIEKPLTIEQADFINDKSHGVVYGADNVLIIKSIKQASNLNGIDLTPQESFILKARSSTTQEFKQAYQSLSVDTIESYELTQPQKLVINKVLAKTDKQVTKEQAEQVNGYLKYLLLFLVLAYCSKFVLFKFPTLNQRFLSLLRKSGLA